MIKACDSTEPHGWHRWPDETAENECLGVDPDGTVITEVSPPFRIYQDPPPVRVEQVLYCYICLRDNPDQDPYEAVTIRGGNAACKVHME